MNYFLNLLESVAVIGSADGPTEIVVAGELPLPAITLVAVVIALVIYTYTAKAIRNKKAASAPEKAIVSAPAASVETPAASVQAAAPVQPGVELVGCDEKTAAVIMAIVSDKTGIPLNRLDFKSIKLMEDK